MAKSIPALVAPTMLRWARVPIDLPAIAACRKLDLPDDRVAAWEASDERPTVAQLRKAARLYRRSLGVFFLPEPPQGSDTLRDLRRHGGAAAGPWSPVLHANYRRAHEQREHVLDLAEADDIESPSSWRIEFSGVQRARTRGSPCMVSYTATWPAQIPRSCPPAATEEFL